ncbi:hypothetical protein M8818_006303 [Zalaria obscura]|uniref:Uncharacterized protein n=1 Tax=Zalaria obscura TaxID=2024903 RepID=A0ACC3S7X8_9PEZI
MPLLTLHLLRLTPSTTPETFLTQINQVQPSIDIVVASRPRHLVIHTESLDPSILNDTKWDLLLLARTSDGSLPGPAKTQVEAEYKIFVGVPSRVLNGYGSKNAKLVKTAPSAPLTGALEKARVPSSSQNLELSPALLTFMDELGKEYDGPVTMLNLLHFNEGGKGSYYQYGQGFVEVAGRRGGDAKIVGNVVAPPEGQSDARGDGDEKRKESGWWNEISIVHYPSIRHFCDMLAGEDYQGINEKYRLGVSCEFTVKDGREMRLTRLTGAEGYFSTLHY